MKAYFTVSIPQGEYLVAADTANGKKLDYLDFADRALLYRYFDPGAVKVERVTARVARKSRTRPVKFSDLFSFGSWR